MGVHINFLGEMKDEKWPIRVVRTGPVKNLVLPRAIWWLHHRHSSSSFFFISSKTRWAIIQHNRKCLKSFLSTRFYFILFCLLDPKGPSSTERVEFLYISPTVQPKITFRFSNSLSRVALFGLLIKNFFFTSSRLPISAGEKIHWEKNNRFTGTILFVF